MGKKITLHCFVHSKRDDWGNSLKYMVFSCDDMSSCGWILVGPHEVEYEIPDGFNPIAAEVSALVKYRDKLHGEYMAQAVKIDKRIADLLCIEMSPEAK